MTSQSTYQVVVGGEPFQLTGSQIGFDSPNYFTMSFLGDFREGKTLQLDIPRDSHLFRIIQKYLKGYTVLPLSYNQIPLDATRESMMANLREDAVFYQLDGLAYAIDALTLPYVALMKPSEWHLAFLGTYVHTSDQEDPG
ncbi:hypothetical protein RHS04_08116 [Rhizoctonia solani]|uniref:Potassium channel tetramerisation-type BTB domain-containing protein n=1 Tax=Rhizoctonia solani TaxID=456999 RepID=A0A8H7H3U2_9AGAM|nr:hypothetical protein RHS04_08116 [Rhizoctonia solani]